MKKYVKFEMDLITFVAQDIVTFSAFGGVEDDLTEEENGVKTAKIKTRRKPCFLFKLIYS